jgi:cob(I)alamin adenosyltransferase
LGSITREYNLSIATKTGDKGRTSLLSGERVRKDNIRVEAYGTLDELNSFLGEAKHACKQRGFFELIESVQTDLFKLCAELASEAGTGMIPINESDVERLTAELSGMESRLDLKGFVLPGNSPASGKLDICRSVARRGERRIIALSAKKKINGSVIKYINRLSDLLFIMARVEERSQKYVK